MAELTANIVRSRISKTDISKTADLKVSAPGSRFTLVHDGKKVLAQVENGERDVTKTGPQNQMACFTTKEEVKAFTEKNGLEPLKEDRP